MILYKFKSYHMLQWKQENLTFNYSDLFNMLSVTHLIFVLVT